MSDQNPPLDISQTSGIIQIPTLPLSDGKDLTTDPNILAVTSFLQQAPEYTQNQIPDMGSFQSHENSREKDRISERMAGFNPKDNDVWRRITAKFGPNIKQPELLSIANVLAQNCNVKLDRDAKRRKSVLIKWFEENWVTISPYLDYVVLEDGSHQN